MDLEESIAAITKEQGSDESAPQKWEETVNYLRDIIAKYGPFDGIGGFSEGAATAHNLLRMQQAGIDVGLSGVKFCLAMSPVATTHTLVDQKEHRGPLLEREAARHQQRPDLTAHLGCAARVRLPTSAPS